MAWNRPSEEKKVEGKGGGGQWNVHLKGLVAGVIVVVGAAIAAWFMTGRTKTLAEAKEPRNAMIRDLGTGVVPVRTNAVETVRGPKDPNAFDDFEIKGLVKSEKLPDGTVLRTWADGHKSILVNPMTKEELEAKLANRRYTNPVDWTLAGIVHPDWEDMPIPDRITDEQVRAWLSEPVRIDMNKDDDQSIDEKSAVIELRQDLLAYLDRGGHAEDYFREIQKRQASAAIKLQESRAIVLETFRKGDYRLAKDLLNKLNENMREQGLPSVRFGRRFHEILEERTSEK